MRYATSTALEEVQIINFNAKKDNSIAVYLGGRG